MCDLFYKYNATKRYNLDYKTNYIKDRICMFSLNANEMGEPYNNNVLIRPNTINQSQRHISICDLFCRRVLVFS